MILKTFQEYQCIVSQNKPLISCPLQTGVEALKMRYLRHVKAPMRPQGEHTMQLNIIRKDSTQSGQEELHTESITVTVKEGADEPVPTKPGMNKCVRYTDQVYLRHRKPSVEPCYIIITMEESAFLHINLDRTVHEHYLEHFSLFLVLCVGEKLMTLKQRLQLAMAQRRQEERVRKAELNRLDNEDCGEEEEEEEMTDESEDEEVRGRVVSHCCAAINLLYTHLCFCPFLISLFLLFCLKGCR